MASGDDADGRADVSTHETGPGDAGGTDGDLDILKRGSTVGRYLVLERLGAGAMGVVYAAYDPKLERKIALKLLRPQPGRGDQARRTARLEREAQATAKLSHPNVVGIFDVGVHEDQVFMAMEYLAGGTLRDWLKAEKRPWRDIVKMFIAVGQGLAAAHTEGLIHRDFKPDNVLLDKNGVPKVVDFGLVRLSPGIDVTASGSNEENAEDSDGAAATLPPMGQMPAALTRTGALAGTPAYMAPEQFLGKPINAKTDQFAFCVALYEALYGERPFAGDTVFSLADSVTSGRIRQPQKGSNVPGWVYHNIIVGLAAIPIQRHLSLQHLLRILERDPSALLRRRVLVSLSVVLAIASIAVVQRRADQRRRDFESQIATFLAEGDSKSTEATVLKKKAYSLRAHALTAFDEGRRDDAEQLWSETRSTATAADDSLEHAERALRSALDLDRNRTSTQQQLADVIYERALLAELEFRKHDVKRHVDRMLDVDNARLHARWYQPGTLTLMATPDPTTLSLEKYVENADGRLSTSIMIRANLPLIDQRLEPGSYRAILTSAGRETIIYPFFVRRGEHVSKTINLPLHEKVPDGFVLIPAGKFITGEADESLRVSFLDAAPIHEASTESFLIAKHETTYQEWIEFLQALPPNLVERHLPSVSTHRDYLRLRRFGGSWRIELRPTTTLYTAALGETITYPERTIRKSQDWARMPVGGISVDDIEAYLHWRALRVVGARLCTEWEWERAARGADDRVFPHGNILAKDDANFDLTYGRKSLAFGPDEVGAHPLSISPFGLHDMAGNLLEITSTKSGKDQFSGRGGGYYYDTRSARLTNREPVDRSLRYPAFGFRVCADAPS
ncbi:MAG TPA: bifunctional serine/threonine-protein kinase/formylglycine-generating enzyme family protein [Polyangia bacterium]|nr:bifunctional serine/threonine-protein kinase/formylglycine-generating enzyme family protein [Polyangia bacterium]